jgi:hypothetical protein
MIAFHGLLLRNLFGPELLTPHRNCPRCARQSEKSTLRAASDEPLSRA